MNWKYIKRDSKLVNEELIIKVKAGDSYSEELLIKNNIPLIKHFAVRWINRGSEIEYDELLSIGGISIVKAIQKFDIHSGYKFTTLLVKILINDFATTERDNKTQKLKKFSIVSMDQKFDDEDGNDYHNILAGDTLKMNFVDKDQVTKILGQFRKVATKNELDIIQKHYFEKQSLADIARQSGLTRSAISATHMRAIKQLRLIAEGKFNEISSVTSKPAKPRKEGAVVSGVKGIVWDYREHRWRVKIRENGKEKQIGRFINLNDAIYHQESYFQTNKISIL